MSTLITPRTLSGFRDYLPSVMLAREEVLRRARDVYRSYGFTPIDTPACESLEVLLGKGGDESDKLVYRVQSARGEGEAEMGLRFDLTVPFARFSAQYINELGTPFKRYAMGPVWRGERPGKGRYREFWQCDFDTIGTTSNAADTETALVINDLFTAIGFEKFEIRINNRLVLNGLLELQGLAEKAVPLLRSLDKLPKIGREKVTAEMMKEAGVTAAQADAVLQLAETTGSNAEVLDKLDAFFAGSPNEKAAEGIRRLRELLLVAKTAGVPEGCIKIDLSICRGLDYYTGTIYETFLTDLPSIGSVCSGGRYDNLASKYTKQVLPGVGASLGLDRLIAAMEELKHPLLTGQTTPAEVLVVNFEAARLGDYQYIARVLRAAGLNVEVFPETRKIGQQLAYAEKRGFKLALIVGPAEFEQSVWKVKDLAEREETTVKEAALGAWVKDALNRRGRVAKFSEQQEPRSLMEFKPMKKYHVALSFAGEDRAYVENVAKRLQGAGVNVFYDKFEETNLWGKDLYTYLSDVYQNQAFFTVMFISEDYKQKLWTNHERRNAQGRAFSENREYILPAFFDTNVEVPGILKTTGYVDLSTLTPDAFADKIIDKLEKSGVLIVTTMHSSYSDAARADVDFSLREGDEVSEIITALRSYSWYKQSPAIEKIFKLDWQKRTPDEAFVLGRNIYQCADGGEHRAEAIMKDLRRELAKFSDDWAEHILNGMFYEVYFNHEGKFRGAKLKTAFLSQLFALETVARFEKSITYIQYALDPYRGSLGVLPNKTPEVLRVKVKIETKDPPLLTSVKAQGKEQLVTAAEDEAELGWRFSYRGFTLDNFSVELMKFWNIPEGHLKIDSDKDLPGTTKVSFPKGKTLGSLKI